MPTIDRVNATVWLSQLRQNTPDKNALRSLKLSKDEMDIVIHGAEEERERSKSRFWWF
jgi:hypothetical protein